MENRFVINATPRKHTIERRILQLEIGINYGMIQRFTNFIDKDIEKSQ